MGVDAELCISLPSFYVAFLNQICDYDIIFPTLYRHHFLVIQGVSKHALYGVTSSGAYCERLYS